MKAIHYAFLIVCVYAALLTGFIIGHSSAMSYPTMPILEAVSE